MKGYVITLFILFGISAASGLESRYGLPHGSEVLDWRLSVDGKNFYVVYRAGGGRYVNMNGYVYPLTGLNPGPEYGHGATSDWNVFWDEFYTNGVNSTIINGQVFYGEGIFESDFVEGTGDYVFVLRGGRGHIVLNGRAIDGFTSRYSYYNVGRNFLFSYTSNDLYFLNIDGRVSGPYRNTLVYRDSYRLPFVVYGFCSDCRPVNGVSSGGTWTLCIGRKEMNIPGSLQDLALSADGSKYVLSYISNDGRYASGADYVNWNGKVYGPYSYVQKLVLSEDGTSVLCVVYDRQQWFLFYNGSLSGGYHAVDIREAIALNRGGGYAVCGMIGNEPFLRFNDKEYRDLDSEPGVHYKRGNTNFGFSYESNNQYFTYLNGETYGPYAFSSVALSGLGNRYLRYYNIGGVRNGYELAGGKYFVEVSGKKFGGYDRVANPVFSPDGSGYLFAYRNGAAMANIGAMEFGGWHVICSGQDCGVYDFVDPERLRFSPDSRHWAFGFLRDGKTYALVDGREYSLTRFADFAFTSDNRVLLMKITNDEVQFETMR